MLSSRLVTGQMEEILARLVTYLGLVITAKSDIRGQGDLLPPTPTAGDDPNGSGTDPRKFKSSDGAGLD